MAVPQKYVRWGIILAVIVIGWKFVLPMFTSAMDRSTAPVSP